MSFADSYTETKAVRRKKFLLFVKILFRLLERSGDDLLLEQAKLVILKYRHNASLGLTEHTMESDVRDLVGDHLFVKAKIFKAVFLRRQKQQGNNKKNNSQSTRAAQPNRESGIQSLCDVMATTQQFIERIDRIKIDEWLANATRGEAT